MNSNHTRTNVIYVSVLFFISIYLLYVLQIFSIKIFFVSLLAYIGFTTGLCFYRYIPDQYILYRIWVSGVVSGSIILSTGLLLIPRAVSMNAESGSMGLVFGLLLGYVIHHISHQFFHHSEQNIQPIVINLSTHSIIAGIILSFLYSQLPGLSIAFGIAIISHKLPAGIGLAKKVNKKNIGLTHFLPSVGVAIGAILISILNLSIPRNLLPIIAGLSAGIFLHVGVDLLPECASGKNVSCSLDKQRRHAVLSSSIGAALIFIVITFS